MRKKIPALILLVVSFGATVAWLAGCGVLSFRASRPTFSHADHVAQGIRCDACHPSEKSSEVDLARAVDVGAPEMPVYATCRACHGPSKHRESYDYELEIQSEDPAKRFVVRSPSFDLRFSHSYHARHGAKCEDCHVDIDGDAASLVGFSAPSSRADRCDSCHAEAGVSSDCSVCHASLRRDVAPPSHGESSFLVRHGEESRRADGRGHAEDCSTCHTENQCDSCHRVQRPADHTAFFRVKGHGLQVSISRERCQTCHVESSCVRCHEETRPRSHNAAFGGMRSNHCLHCHEPLESTSCSACHRGVPTAHLGATRIPPPPHPTAISDCRRCHLRPPHADNGMDCTVCHK